MQPPPKRHNAIASTPLINELNQFNQDSFQINNKNEKKITDSAKVDSIALIVLLPNEIIDKIFSHLDAKSQLEFSNVARKFKNYMNYTPKISFNILFEQAVKNSLETINEFDDLKSKDIHFDHLSGILCQSNLKKALEIATLERKEYQHRYFEIALHLTKNDPEAAIAFIEKYVDDFENQNLLYKIGAIKLGESNISKALSIASKIVDVEMYALTLNELIPLASKKAETIFQLAIEATNHIEIDSQAWIRSLLINSISKVNQQLAENNLHLIEDLEYSELSMIEVAVDLSSKNLNQALSIVNRIKHLPKKIKALTSVATRISKINPTISKELFFRALTSTIAIQNQFENDKALQSIADRFSILNLEIGLVIARTIKDERTKDYCLANIASTKAKNNPKIALKITNNIQYTHYKNSALRSITKALIPTDPIQAYKVAKKITQSEIRDQLYEKIAVTYALIDKDWALKVAKQITTIAQVKASTYIKIAIKISHKKPLTARDIIKSTIEEIKALKGIQRSNCELAICEELQKYLTNYTD